ncbi:hypothetical protein KDX38_17265 [Pseudomonas sp. CDFA 602]|uniref:WD40 repeat domain-containing protein n=1 Tax=Pseudomonas californiensis TaxID=2829823 RepID=UPI001E639B85|nr:hypothetical protein [Pseudomonas californiensis]MCD5995448.1 hypothetical protein [Pseudomonas californiensis]MCD6000956.1 hypothetical protein [Pseudomonas californiensis]
MTDIDENVDAVLRLPTLWQQQGDERINALGWSGDDLLIAAAYADGSVAVMSSLDGTVLWQTAAHGMDASAVQWSPDGSLLATAGQAGGVALWNAREGTLVHRLEAGNDWIENLSWSADGLLAVACGAQVTVWNMQGELIQRLQAVAGTVTGLHWLPDGRLFSSCYGGVAQWSVEHSEPQRFFAWKDSLLGVSISPSQRFVATGCQGSAVHLWYLDSGEDFQMSGYPAKVRHMTWSADSTWFGTASGGMVVIWNCTGAGPQNTQPIMLPVHEKTVNALTFSHKDHRLASAGQDGLVFVFDAGRAQPLAGLHNRAAVSSIAWSHDDRVIAVGDQQGSLKLCAVPTSAQLQSTATEFAE